MKIPELLKGRQITAGCGMATVLPEMDFETFSEAGFIWDEEKQNYYKPPGAAKKGISAVGAVVYTEHPTMEAMCLAYDLKDGLGPRLWVPGTPDPQDLFDYLATGGFIEAVNCQFEYWTWKNYCTPKLGWPELPWHQLKDAAAKFRAHGYPGALGPAAEVSGAEVQKMTEGKRLIKKFGCPKKPTKKDPRKRIRPEDEPGGDGQLLYDYCLGDIAAESAVSMLCPDLSPEETEHELYTRASNVRGIALDTVTIDAGVSILNQALIRYDEELKQITGGAVEKGSQGQRLREWLSTQGITTPTLDKDDVKRLLKTTDVDSVAHRALTIRQLVGSAGVKKLYAMQRMVSREGRVHDLIVYHGAKTGRDNGRDLQPLNLVKAGPKLLWCGVCEKPYGQHVTHCPHCGCASVLTTKSGWKWEAVDHAVEVIRTGSLDEVERVFGDALLTLSGCIRGLFTSAPGHDLICSDYSSIEAVVTAVLAGEQWRIDAFNNKEDIYLRSASRVTGTPYEEYLAHPDGPKAHPDRQNIGKPAELGLGFGGWIGAWRQFDSSDTFTDEEAINNIKAWRAASPAIVELWGGQVRGVPWSKNYELFGMEGTAINAIKNPGQVFDCRGMKFGVKDDIMYLRLLSGRLLTYHKPRLSPHHRWDDQLAISFEGYNTNPQKGKIGWIRMSTYGGDLMQGAVQATARDLMFHSIPHLWRAGYPVVLRVHDELVAEVPEGFGSIEELERIMGTVPAWAGGWPVRASDGWRGKRYRKD